MPIQIANPTVVAKIERLAAVSGLSKTAAVEKAVDAMLAGLPDSQPDDMRARFDAILAEFDKLPERPDAFDPLEWDEHGLPR